MDRRQLLGAGGFTFLAAGGTGARGPEVSPSAPGVTIQIRHYRGKWEVLVPDWDIEMTGKVVNGYYLPAKWAPLTELLDQLEKLAMT